MIFAPRTEDRPRNYDAAIKRTIKEFEEKGGSQHSPLGTLLAPLLNHCVNKAIPFTLLYLPGGGYYVKKEKFPT